jgi:adenine-specific DNA methylase
MIPLEAARLGVRTWGIDYSPVATLAGALLADYPLRDWSQEPPLPFDDYLPNPIADRLADRLLYDVQFVLELVGRRFELAMDEFYPLHNGKRPWGYLWSMTLPCQECGYRFPLTGSLVLRHPLPRKNDPGQSYRIEVDRTRGIFWAAVHEGPPTVAPTLTKAPGTVGKAAVCPFCEHVHSLAIHRRLAAEGLGQDAILVAADIDRMYGKVFREPAREEIAAAERAEKVLADESDFILGVPAVPTEQVPVGNGRSIMPLVYGATDFGKFCNARQTLGLVRLCRIIAEIGEELLQGGCTRDYASALTGYCASVLSRKVRRSTRGAYLQVYGDGRPTGVMDIFINEASIAFSHDYFEVALSDAAGSWHSVSERTIAALRDQCARPRGNPAQIQRGSALALPLADERIDAVVTDPPYDEMVPYTDVSDLFYVWLKRALYTTHPDFVVTADPRGVQEKAEEIIVKRTTSEERKEHRTREFYDAKIAEAFGEARRVVKPDGVVTIVFGHGDPDVWHRLLTAIDTAKLVLTGSWPARTEKGGKAGYSNITTTLTLACRPAPEERESGRVAEVDAEVRRVIAERVPLWDAAGLALTDQLMAAAGPAMEVVGRYSVILDKRGDPVALDRYLPLARRAVEEAADIKIDALPLGTFDPRTRFGLFWARLYGRAVTAGSEARWQRLASDLTEADTEGILTTVPKGVRLATAEEAATEVNDTSANIDIAFALAAAGKSVIRAAEVLAATGRAEDPYLWAALGELSRAVPEADPDGDVWTWLVRNRTTLIDASGDPSLARQTATARREHTQGTLFGGDI